jgi:acyl-CoA hydrolase
VKVIDLDALPARLRQLPTNPRVVVSGNFATPRTVLGVLDRTLPQYVLHVLNAQPGLPERDGVIHETTFVGPGVRHSPRLEYLPCRLSLVPVLLARYNPPDVVLIHTSTPVDGTVSLGVEVNILPAAIEAARARGGLVIAAANPQMPYTYGDAQIDVTDIDLLVEVDEPLITHNPSRLDDISAQIGDRIAHRVLHGSTLQLGIGAVPDAVLASLAHHRGMRIWSEMFSDGVLALHHGGCFDEDIPLTASFLFGSSRLYEWVDRNRRVRMVRTERANDPGQIAKQPRMTSVNAALQVDLFGQANASRINGRIFSGFGGSTDFIVGALHSAGGHAYIALPSWHPKARCSTVVPRITEPVTSFQHSAIVSENGIARVFGNSEREQAYEIIEQVAHPDSREELREAAQSYGLLRRSRAHA